MPTEADKDPVKQKTAQVLKTLVEAVAQGETIEKIYHTLTQTPFGLSEIMFELMVATLFHQNKIDLLEFDPTTGDFEIMGVLDKLDPISRYGSKRYRFEVHQAAPSTPDQQPPTSAAPPSARPADSTAPPIEPRPPEPTGFRPPRVDTTSGPRSTESTPVSVKGTGIDDRSIDTVLLFLQQQFPLVFDEISSEQFRAQFRTWMTSRTATSGGT